MENRKYQWIVLRILKGFAAFVMFGLLTSNVFAQDLLVEGFYNTWPPAGWTTEPQPGNWSVSPTMKAGGQAPEARLSGSPAFFNITRLLSPTIDLSGLTLVRLSFQYSIEHLLPGYSVGIATRNGNGPWVTRWSTVPVSGTSADNQSVTINYPGFNSPDFQFCFFFQGNSQNISAFYIDDVRLVLPPTHDLMLKSIANAEVNLPNALLTPSIIISNNGQNHETMVPVVCRIYDGSNQLLYNNQVIVSQFTPGNCDTVHFPSYVLALTNEFYRIESSVLLTSDVNVTNDTISKIISTLSLVERRFVLTEMATATWCPQCPAQAQAGNDLILAGKKIALAEYHSPSGDIFTNPDAAARLEYYDVIGYPTTIFDGVLTSTGSSNVYTEYENRYNERIQKPSPYDIKIYGTHTGNDYSLKIILYRMAPVLRDNLVLRVILTESGIPYNWQGQTQLDHVARLMIPHAQGTPVDLRNYVQLSVPLTFTMQPGWIPENCEVIAFIQDTVSKEVLQVFKRTYYELVPFGFTKIQGYIRYNGNAAYPLAGVSVSLRLGGGVVAVTNTAPNGYYSFTGIAPGNYYLSCNYNGSWGGSNAADALLVMKYFVSLETLNPLQIKAADNDVSNFVNTTDALNIARRFVGYITKFTQGNWVFETPVISLPNSTIVTRHINGLCTGDIDGSYIP